MSEYDNGLIMSNKSFTETDSKMRGQKYFIK